MKGVGISNFCPICEEERSDILGHLSLDHEIGDEATLEKIITKAEEKLKRKQEFTAFINELNQREKEGKINTEQWKAERDRWEREHPAIMD